MAATRILVVEDELIIARSVDTKLRKSGYTVVDIAESGENAIRKAAKLRPDLVLMDILLQGDMDGITAAHQIWQNLQIPVVYLTAYADHETLERARATSPFGYLLKPLRSNDFHPIIQMALQKAAQEKSLIQDKTRLLQEVEHRVKNTLQLIASLLRLQIGETDAAVTSPLLATQNRVMAIALAHQNAYAEEHLAAVNIPQYLQALLIDLFEVLAIPQRRICHQFHSADALAQLTLPLEIAVPCGLILNEILTSALRHGFQARNRYGKVGITLSPGDRHHLNLTVTSNGAPLPPTWMRTLTEIKPVPATLLAEDDLSLRLIQLLTKQVEGQFLLRSDEGGTVFKLSLPLPE